ncbi:dioxygenase [Nocardia sp. NPDC004860]|uniref:dioxygenase family protein n=1 Tax=Nocardia sp. NPDC004860 TaxID=3154557 RepID=UPI0033B1439D
MSSVSDHLGPGFTEEASAEVTAAAFDGTPDARLREILQRLTHHVHAFVKDIGLTQSEWEQGIEFLTATGQKCDATRQEFILLSDVFGVSMLVDAITHRVPRGATESTVLGPFHMTESPRRELGENISAGEGGDPCLILGTVRSVDGEPIPDAVVDVWQADDHGFYDVQNPGTTPAGNLRGLFTTDPKGSFHFRTIVPAPYPIPTDGPVGMLLERAHRHPYRPAHIHFIAQADGCRPLITHIFVAGSPYLDSDAVFGVKDSLITAFRTIDDPVLAQRYGMPNPCTVARIDLVLAAES